MRTEAEKTADKYIQPGGAPLDYDRAAHAADLMNVVNFIAWQDAITLWCGVRGSEAFTSLARIVNLPEATLRRISGASNT
jgi:hypothetical protein